MCAGTVISSLDSSATRDRYLWLFSWTEWSVFLFDHRDGYPEICASTVWQTRGPFPHSNCANSSELSVYWLACCVEMTTRIEQPLITDLECRDYQHTTGRVVGTAALPHRFGLFSSGCFLRHHVPWVGYPKHRSSHSSLSTMFFLDLVSTYTL